MICSKPNHGPGIKRNFQHSTCIMSSAWNFAGIWSRRERCCLYYKEFSYTGWVIVHSARLPNSYRFAYSHWERQGGKFCFWFAFLNDSPFVAHVMFVCAYKLGFLNFWVYFTLFVCLFQVISTWGVKNKIDFLSLSYTRHAEDVRQVIYVPKPLLWYVISDSFIIGIYI